MISDPRFAQRALKAVGAYEALQRRNLAGALSERDYETGMRRIESELAKLKNEEADAMKRMIASAHGEKKAELESKLELVNVYSSDDYAEYLRREYGGRPPEERFDRYNKWLKKKPRGQPGYDDSRYGGWITAVIVLALFAGAGYWLYAVKVHETNIKAAANASAPAYDCPIGNLSFSGADARLYVADNRSGCWKQFCKGNSFSGKLPEYLDGCYFTIARMNADKGNNIAAVEACSLIADTNSSTRCVKYVKQPKKTNITEAPEPWNKTANATAAADDYNDHQFEYDIITKMMEVNESVSE